MVMKTLYMMEGSTAIKTMHGWHVWHYKKYDTYVNLDETTNKLITVRYKDGTIPERISDWVRKLLKKRGHI